MRLLRCGNTPCNTSIKGSGSGPQLGDSPEVGPLQILRVSFLLGNGQAPSDIPSDTKISIRGVQKFKILKNL